MSESLLRKLSDSLEYKRIHKVYEFMVRVAKEFNLTVVSCGINSNDLLKIVKHMDVEIGVGKYFSESLERNDFIRFLMDNKKRFKIL
jgi:EAL domain-containing protein (putative c-di-GMP-specific phosphodiesterase class I)